MVGTFLSRVLARWVHLSLRQTLVLGSGLGILLPALLLAYFQGSSRMDDEINLRVRQPLLQYTDVLSRGVALAIWNMDNGVAVELIDAVMRNPDVIDVSVTDEYQQPFVQRSRATDAPADVLREEREVLHDGARVGRLVIVMSTARVRHEFWVGMGHLGLGLGAQVLISFLLIRLLLNRRLMRPLKKLEEGAQRLARGELDQPLRWRRADEIGRLASGLDTMRQDLASLIAEREQQNRTLQTELQERKRVEHALQLSQAKFVAIFEASPVALAVAALGAELKLLDVNGAWLRTFRAEREAALSNPDVLYGLWELSDVRQTLLDALLGRGEIANHVAWMHRGNSMPKILCEVSGRSISVGDEAMVILAFEDITAKREYENQILRLNASLEDRVSERTRELTETLTRLTQTQSELVRSEKMAALGALVAGIAHELNTPIGNSLTVASTLQDMNQAFNTDRAEGLKRSRLDEYVANVTQGTEILMHGLHHAAELIASFKQVAVDQTSVNRRVFDLRDTVAEILLTLGPTIRKTRHAVEQAVDAEIMMESYPGPLGQVLSNLVNNALMHAFEGREHGKITISARKRGFDGVQITVRDDGVGIAPDHLARVFDPFFTTKLGRGGSGLGLHIVYNLVTKSLGGSISVESPAGQGACFVIELPLVAPQANREGAP